MALVATLTSGLLACEAQAPQTAPGSGTEMRVLVKLTRPSVDTQAIAAQVAAAAATPARYLAATSAQWHALALECPDAAACDAALRRLGADSATFEVAQRDEMKRIVRP